MKSLRLMTLMLAALGLAMGAAHVLELPVKMRYEPELYLRVTSTLYRCFGLVGGVIQVSAILAAGMLAWALRNRRSSKLTLVGAILLVSSLILWAALVQPVNSIWATVLSQNPAAAVDAYQLHRDRWEYGHVAAFIVWTLGTMSLMTATLQDIAPDP